MNLMRAFAGLVAGGCLLALSANASHAATYTLRFYDVDDLMQAAITNSAYNQVLILGANYSSGGVDTGDVDISSFVRPGQNVIRVTDQNANSSGGYVYGFDFKIDGTLYDADHCGTFNTAGCDGSVATGIVYSHDIRFTVAGLATPLPASLPLFASGLAMLGLLGRRRKRSARSISA